MALRSDVEGVLHGAVDPGPGPCKGYAEEGSRSLRCKRLTGLGGAHGYPGTT